ncbi:Imm30 family immunity protein [Clostridium gasigenes]|uniref:Immunity protein 30 n=1 Tax=Clostridium gasigenes TaxID=94869 RepID=A0A1H0QFZ5_9CLOT|nr:Imm30 family immunity protein [Clostridium gasigenes]MBB6624500.1 hypothetical protein [Clostridium gasigenes]SDP16301.1 Immunity protein 30 [Clostridium gasigenes]
MNLNQVNIELDKLKNNRLLRDRDEFINFEEAVQNLSNVRDPKIIIELCKCLDDNTEDEEVMFGLVHLIEDFDEKDGLLELAKAVPKMLPQAKKWVKILHYRILNDAPSRRMYKSIFKILDDSNKEIIKSILLEISHEDNAEFSGYINEIL